MRTWVLVALVIGAGCKKEAATQAPGSPMAPASTKDQDALWALAPSGAKLGVVVSPRGIAAIEGGVLAIKELFAAAPELAELNAQWNAGLTKLAGSPNVTLADLGLTHDKGFAVFAVDPNSIVVVLPVTDRDKFLAKVKGKKGDPLDTFEKASCKMIADNYICATTTDLFGRLGKGDVKEKLKAAGARGDLEFAGSDLGTGHGRSIAVVAQLERGAIVVRGTIAGVPGFVTSKLGAPAKPRVDPRGSAGFGVMNLGPLVADLPAEPIVKDVTLADLGRSVAGPLTLAIAAGTTDLDIRIPLNDPAPAKAVVEHCTDIPSLATAGATIVNGGCHVPIPKTGFAIDGWVDGKELRIGQRGGATNAVSAALSPIGAELANGEWSIAFFGRGTLLGLTNLPGLPAGQVLRPEAQIGIRAFTMMNELGIGIRVDGDSVHFIVGVRTAWANPDDVVHELVAIAPDQVIHGQARELAKRIADRAPKSPFAGDFKAGLGGVIALAAPIGILAAVAIPAFADYMKKPRKTEASLQLNKIAKNAKVAYIENAAFPKGDAPLTPTTACCVGPAGKCPVDTAAWKRPVWQALDFEITEPHLFQYAYHSDGKTFSALAVGDLDCDGTAITYEARGTIENGNPSVKITEPPPGSD